VALGMHGSGVMLTSQTPRTPALARVRRVVVVSAHPDDAETGAGGTIARYVDAGWRVTVLYLTRGEAGIEGTDAGRAAAWRTEEAERACASLGARAVFADEPDGAVVADARTRDRFTRLLAGLAPDVVFGHWPLDTHRDHRVAARLTHEAWLSAERRFALYHYEVLPGAQTVGFRPTDFVDITTVEQRKRRACFAHDSQDMHGGWAQHERASRLRGEQAGVARAEAFVRTPTGPRGWLPGHVSYSVRLSLLVDAAPVARYVS
jgi:LmbE family N-acetylglucosaminyl deacetylase